MKRYFLFVIMIVSVALLAGCGSSNQMLQAGGMDVGKELMGSFGSVGDILGSITDVASAEAAAPKLDVLNTDLDGIVSAASSLSPEGKLSISEMAASQIPPLKAAMDTAYAIPGVKDVIQPPMDSLLEKYAGF